MYSVGEPSTSSAMVTGDWEKELTLLLQLRTIFTYPSLLHVITRQCPQTIIILIPGKPENLSTNISVKNIPKLSHARNKDISFQNRPYNLMHSE